MTKSAPFTKYLTLLTVNQIFFMENLASKFETTKFETLLVLGWLNSHNTGVWGWSPGLGNIPPHFASGLFNMNIQF